MAERIKRPNKVYQSSVFCCCFFWDTHLGEPVLRVTLQHTDSHITSLDKHLMDTPGRIPAARLAGPGQITDYLYISNGKTAKDSSVLTRLKISCIINATQEMDAICIPSVEYLQVPVSDSPAAQLQEHFDTVADKIHAVRAQRGRVLVHCCAGVSRSATLCLAYLVKYRDMSLMDAHTLVRACRPIIRPNSGFWKQLIDYERSLRGANSVMMVASPLGQIPDLYEKYTKDLIPL
ncbi:dual specificity protein phosphatase 18 isoform X1 [Pangasianodon hypophthalmus]|uniref:dual specificity protein phosphatase 18 isoform X1 n=2 Tax=Pangasianodon hypophthalmus TaxID=310915 RepID=UPI000EFE5A95|nr:dual specificity protein phosphatase 18 isoform X1 [Pangasianodon hypophthalmus]